VSVELKQKIIHEALKLFSLKGFLSTSTHDIMKAANTSKGGLYNHFESKEDLFFAVLKKAQEIWRERVLEGMEQVEAPVEKIKRLLENYRDLYLKDSKNFPGGCIFVTLSVELDDLKGMIKKLLDQGKARGQVRDDVKTEAITEMIFAGMLGASVIYGTEKSTARLDQSINSLIEYIERLSPTEAS
jgi:TetR/AcrR family transcriptional repressor of nem operon